MFGNLATRPLLNIGPVRPWSISRNPTKGATLRTLASASRSCNTPLEQPVFGTSTCR